MPGPEWSGAETAALVECCKIVNGRYVLAYRDTTIAARLNRLFPNGREFNKAKIRSHLHYIRPPAHEPSPSTRSGNESRAYPRERG